MAQIIDAVGWDCPKPIIHTKQLLDTMSEGTVCTIVDNEIARNNLADFGKSLGYTVEQEEKDGLWRVYTTKPAGMERVVSTGSGCFVLVVASDQFGQGNEEFSRALMKTYLYTLGEVTPRPDTMIFMNAGVFFTTEDSPVEDVLHTMEGEGVEILSCGACLDFYGVKDKVVVGSVGNMYAIAEKMNRATKVIRL